jgi:uncharacterized OB-fold protein
MLVAVCEACGWAVFPARALCPRCGAAAWREEPAAGGTVEEVSRTRQATIASVRLDRGPVVIVRVENGVGRGSRVDLSA